MSASPTKTIHPDCWGTIPPAAQRLKIAAGAPSTGWGTIPQAAEHYQLSTDSIRRMIARGEIEAKRFGPRLIRVNLASIEASARPIGGAKW